MSLEIVYSVNKACGSMFFHHSPCALGLYLVSLSPLCSSPGPGPCSPAALLHSISFSEYQVISECPVHRSVDLMDLITVQPGLLLQHLQKRSLWSALGQGCCQVPLSSPLPVHSIVEESTPVRLKFFPTGVPATYSSASVLPRTGEPISNQTVEVALT